MQHNPTVDNNDKLTLKEIIAMGIGGIIAMLTGLSYARPGLVFQSSGGRFTFLELAFTHRNIAAIGG